PAAWLPTSVRTFGRSELCYSKCSPDDNYSPARRCRTCWQQSWTKNPSGTACPPTFIQESGCFWNVVWRRNPKTGSAVFPMRGLRFREFWLTPRVCWSDHPLKSFRRLDDPDCRGLLQSSLV